MPQGANFTCCECRRDFKDKEGLRRHIAFAHGLLYQLTTITRLDKDLLYTDSQRLKCFVKTCKSLFAKKKKKYFLIGAVLLVH